MLSVIMFVLQYDLSQQTQFVLEFFEEQWI